MQPSGYLETNTDGSNFSKGEHLFGDIVTKFEAPHHSSKNALLSCRLYKSDFERSQKFTVKINQFV